MTATPDRSDKVPLGEIFSEVAFEYDMRAAIRDGWLCPIRSFLVQTQADFSGVRKVAGELATGDVERILTQDLHLAEIATPILRERGERPTIVFAASVAHAKALTRVMNEQAGEAGFAVALDGTTSLEGRAPVLQRFRSGQVKVLVNCALFTEGFDAPRIALVAIARRFLCPDGAISPETVRAEHRHVPVEVDPAHGLPVDHRPASRYSLRPR